MSKNTGHISEKINSEYIKDKVLKERKKYTDKLPSGASREIAKNFQIDELNIADCKCYSIHPNRNFKGIYIFYIYGGGMCKNITAAHWEFILRLAKCTGSGVVLPMYPLAPECSCKDTFNMLEKTYGSLTTGYDIERLILMGDSSGAGLALSLAMIAWKEGFRKPDQLILISPLLDTEFFDKELEAQIRKAGINKTGYFFNDGAKEFINKYWVKDYALKLEYTSPFYEDYTDICDDVIIFSGINDMFNCYSRAFYNKAKLQGVNIRFFESDGADHNFMLEKGNAASENAFRYLEDVINEEYSNSMTELYPIKLMASWTKKYPEIIRDEWAERFIYDNKIDFSSINTNISEYRNLMLAASFAACDAKVRKFIMEFPNATIVNLRCGLDNMFARLDNGRIQWYSVDTHNIMSVRRAMYGEREREKTVGRDIMDFTWLDDIHCTRNMGVMFVCNGGLGYLRSWQLKELIEKINIKFPGADLAFTATTSGASAYLNFMYRNKAVYKDRKRNSINDAQKVLGGWGTDYRLISEEPLMKYIGKQKNIKPWTKFAIGYNKITYNHKIIHVRLGSEAYEILVYPGL